jgi:tripartite-type tricarboxylate transporter receptor subunit TctC
MIKVTRRAAPAAAAAALALPGITRAQGQPIRIVVPFAPGGSTDAVARLVSPGLTQRLGVPVVVENRSGAAGSIGADAVAKARPEAVSCGSTGNGTIGHLTMIQPGDQARVRMTHIPYRSGGLAAR